MKKTKVIIPALGILLLSTAASITGTVAWFTSSNYVDAIGVKVQAVVGGNLNIAASSSATLDQINLLKVDLNHNELELNPVDIVANGTLGAKARIPESFSAEPTVTNAGTVSEYKTEAVGTVTPTSYSGFAVDYVAFDFVSIANKCTPAATFLLHPTVTVTLDSDEDLLAGALRAGFVIGADGGDAAYYESIDASISGTTVTLDFLTYPGSAAHTENEVSVDAVDELDDNTPYRLCLMIWYEGDDADCTTNKAITVSESTVSWRFSSAA